MEIIDNDEIIKFLVLSFVILDTKMHKQII